MSVLCQLNSHFTRNTCVHIYQSHCVHFYHRRRWRFVICLYLCEALRTTNRPSIIFLDRELISFRYSSYYWCWGDHLQKRLRLRRFKTDREAIGRIVIQVNTHRLAESDFRFDVTLSNCRPWPHFTQKSAAAWCVYTRIGHGLVWVGSRFFPHLVGRVGSYCVGLYMGHNWNDDIRMLR